MKVKFIGDKTELERGAGLSRTRLDVYGKSFVMGEAVDVSDIPAAQQAKLASNPHFEIVADEVIPAALVSPPAADGEKPTPKAEAKKPAKAE